jgi:hypothetical protein
LATRKDTGRAIAISSPGVTGGAHNTPRCGLGCVFLKKEERFHRPPSGRSISSIVLLQAPCTRTEDQLRGKVPTEHIVADSYETVNQAVAAANSSVGNITCDMLLDLYKKTLEHKPRFVGVDLASKTFFQYDELNPVELCKPKYENITAFRGTPKLPTGDGELLKYPNAETGRFQTKEPNESNCWKDNDDPTGEGPAPRIYGPTELPESAGNTLRQAIRKAENGRALARVQSERLNPVETTNTNPTDHPYY